MDEMDKRTEPVNQLGKNAKKNAAKKKALKKRKQEARDSLVVPDGPSQGEASLPISKPDVKTPGINNGKRLETEIDFAPLSYEAWKASAPQFLNAVFDMPSKLGFEECREGLKIQAKDVAASPHDPEMHLKKALTLQRLGYPELAVSDAYKALLLCEAFLGESGSQELMILARKQLFTQTLQQRNLQPGSPIPLEVVESLEPIMMGSIVQSQKKAYDILQICLMHLEAWQDSIKICRDGLSKFPGDAFLTFQLKTLEALYRRHLRELKARGLRSDKDSDNVKCGSFQTKIYPWTPIHMCTRSNETITAAKEMLKLCSENLEIRISPLTNSADNSPCFGMFATKAIRKGSKLLDSSTAVGVSTYQTAGHCYNCTKSLKDNHTKQFPCCPKMKFCGEKCLKIAEANYHKTLCGKNFDKIYEGTGSHNLEIRSYLRLLAMFVQTGEHPLENPLINWMVPLNAGQRFPVTLEFVTAPIQILQELGADIFDPKYDYWVLLSVWNRLRTNRQAGCDRFTGNAMYAFFNHSCNPNAAEMFPADVVGSRTVLGAAKDIKKGEEVFVTYGPTLSMPRKQRWAVLKNWIGPEGCKCKECRK